MRSFDQVSSQPFQVPQTMAFISQFNSPLLKDLIVQRGSGKRCRRETSVCEDQVQISQCSGFIQNRRTWRSHCFCPSEIYFCDPYNSNIIQVDKAILSDELGSFYIAFASSERTNFIQQITYVSASGCDSCIRTAEIRLSITSYQRNTQIIQKTDARNQVTETTGYSWNARCYQCGEGCLQRFVHAIVFSIGCKEYLEQSFLMSSYPPIGDVSSAGS